MADALDGTPISGLTVAGHEDKLVDVRVELTGLINKPELNGRHGVITAYQRDVGRFGVKLEHNGTIDKNSLSIKPSNLLLRLEASVDRTTRSADKLTQKLLKPETRSITEQLFGGGASKETKGLTQGELKPETRSLAEMLAEGGEEWDMDDPLREQAEGSGQHSGKSKSKRKSKKKGKAPSQDRSMEELCSKLSTTEIAQQQIKEAMDKHHELNKQLDAMTALKPNTDKGAEMLWKRKKALLDKMTEQLDIVRDLSRRVPGSGNDATVSEMRATLEASLIGEG
jgi:hypothetical protein